MLEKLLVVVAGISHGFVEDLRFFGVPLPGSASNSCTEPSARTAGVLEVAWPHGLT